MKPHSSALFILLAGCSGGTGAIATHVPITVAGITYQWPYDRSNEIPDPKTWGQAAWLSTELWNETIGVIPELRKKKGNGYTIVNLKAASAKAWGITSEGVGLPLSSETHFEPKSENGDHILGKLIGPGIVAPPTVVIFKGEPNAYLECSDPSGPNPRGTCVLLLNDRGVEHSQTVPYGKWNAVHGMLPLNRQMIGVPNALR